MTEEMEVDILIIGGGAAGLSAAIKASDLCRENSISDPMIVVLEKASEIGAHSMSGAVLNPVAIKELFPNYKDLQFPIESEVHEDAVYYLTEKGQVKLPITPPPFHNQGNWIVSLSKMNRWLAQRCEERGINIFPGFAAVEAIFEGEKLVAVKTGDKGLNKNGQPKSNFEPGLVLKPKITLFAEGPRGSLFKKISQKLSLRNGKNAEVFEEGVKEIIQMPPGTVKPGTVIHTMGFPLKKSIGGTFIYTLAQDKIALGLVTYLDSRDPLLDPHRELQRLKTHPFIHSMIKGGKVIAYGGKTLPAGGWYSIPQLAGHGWMVVGDSASMVDVQKLKGIHLAMKSGMLAAEIAIEALQSKDFSQQQLCKYSERINQSYVKKELYRVRNFHQTLSQGMLTSLPLIALQEITGGRGLVDQMTVVDDAKHTQKVSEVWGGGGEKLPENQLPPTDGVLFFDKLSSVYLTGTMHDEDSPNHLLVPQRDICRTQCEPQYKSPCNHFCPAKVYEMIPSSQHSGQYELQINYTNCIHCKTCDIKCPFGNIEWTAPEGGGGPRYQET